MTSYASNATYAEIAGRLRAASSVLIISHAKPDGDAVGSMLALHRSLELIGIRSTPLLMGPVEPALIEASQGAPLRRLERDGLPSEEPDLIAIVDTGSWSQLELIAAWLRPRLSRGACIDHHVRGDVDAPQRIVEVTCASTTQALMPLIDSLNVTITPPIATALYMGLATDTGWFRFSSADERVFAFASRLLAAGADKEFLYETLEQSARPARLRLTARALASLELLRDGRIALMTLSREDFAATEGGPEDTGGVVNEPMVIGSVRMSILLSQHEPGITRVSFRSKPLVSGRANEVFDVNELAARFGGGGHRHAAGAKLAMELPAALARVRAEL